VYIDSGLIQFTGYLNEDGKPHIIGEYIALSGPKKDECYFGELNQGLRHGYGKHVTANNDKYTGMFKENERSGYGEIVYSNGDVLQCQFVEGQKHGIGVLCHANGTVRIDEWVKGVRHGPSVFICGDGKQILEVYDMGRLASSTDGLILMVLSIDIHFVSR
jgi:hypothetical protein